MLVVAVMVAFGNLASVAEVAFAEGVLKAGPSVDSVLVAAWTAGMLGGTLAGGRVRRRRLAVATLAGTAIAGTGVALDGGAVTLWQAAAAYGIGGLANGVEVVTTRSFLNHRGPAAISGRVFARTRTVRRRVGGHGRGERLLGPAQPACGPGHRRHRRHRGRRPGLGAVRPAAARGLRLPGRRLDRVVLAPEGRRLLRLEARNSQTPIERKPPWIKTRLRTGPEYTALKSLVSREGLHTVCEEAGCPNIFECWEDREATFLIGGDQCTRRCDFCQIATGKPQPLDTDEPRRVAESVATMGLRYATVTGVARDDLADGGAWLYAQTAREIHATVPGCGVELLIPDFNAAGERLAEVFGARPEVLAHNIETVPRIFRRIRPGFRYERSLEVITLAREAGLVTKSNLILGLGEEPREITEALADLRAAGCELITITQYLRPSPRHHPVERWVPPEEFDRLGAQASDMGFSGVMSGPLVRSSYRAGRLYREAMARRAGPADAAVSPQAR